MLEKSGMIDYSKITYALDSIQMLFITENLLMDRKVWLCMHVKYWLFVMNSVMYLLLPRIYAEESVLFREL